MQIEGEVKFCPRCGSERIGQSAFCHVCGGQLATGPAAGPTVQPTDAADPDATVPVVVAPPSPSTPPLAVPIVAAVTPPPDPRNKPKAGGLSRTALVGGALVIALLGMTAFAFGQVQTTQSTRAELDATNANLTTTNASLATETSDRASAETNARQLESQVSSLKAQLAGRDTCISGLVADAKELSRIQQDWVTNFNRDAETSKLAKARTAAEKFTSTASQDYYNAYKAAFAGNRTSANSWVSKANALVTKANAQVKIVNAQVKAIDAATAKLGADMSVLNESISKTTGLCQAAGS